MLYHEDLIWHQDQESSHFDHQKKVILGPEDVRLLDSIGINIISDKFAHSLFVVVHSFVRPQRFNSTRSITNFP